MQSLIQILEAMKSDTLYNYVIAGLDSSLLNNGKVRYFENSRRHQDQITPHSHRFDFVCLVLTGQVVNRLWNPLQSGRGDLFQVSQLNYTGEVGHHKVTTLRQESYSYNDCVYVEGEVYSMQSDEIHSIIFSPGAKVLFFEGPTIANTSVILEPVVRGRVIKTYEKRDYMFLK